MKKAAAYCMTRNLYKAAIPSIKSLIVNGKPDVIYLLIEDDEFPLKHEKIKVINVSDQQYFKDGPNMNSQFTYMAMMRITLCKYLKESRVLSLDVDTIIDGDISELWELPIKDYYLAGGREPDKSHNGLYINAGVVLFNLKKMKDGKADEIIEALNRKLYGFLEQDAIYEFCQGGIYEMPAKYNFHTWSETCEDPVITHYAGMQHWAHLPLCEKYENMEV